jgi:hypothetical protein
MSYRCHQESLETSLRVARRGCSQPNEIVALSPGGIIVKGATSHDLDFRAQQKEKIGKKGLIRSVERGVVARLEVHVLVLKLSSGSDGVPWFP